MENKTPIPKPKSPSKFFVNLKNIVSEKEHGFTLVELIIVIIIVGILAAVGISQYNTTVEKSRLAEARVRIGTMRQLAYNYYLENGSTTGLGDSYMGNTWGCDSSSWYSYTVNMAYQANYILLEADRCGGIRTGGKKPTGARWYVYGMRYVPATGQSTWCCHYRDGAGENCFGLGSCW